MAHIRSALTRAKLESLSLDPDLKSDIQKGKVCFLCMKTKFGLFAWSHKCRLCQQAVCSKCVSKVRFQHDKKEETFFKRLFFQVKIPEERFDNVPIFALSPNASTSVQNGDPELEEDDQDQQNSSPFSFSITTPSPRKTSLADTSRYSKKLFFRKTNLNVAFCVRIRLRRSNTLGRVDRPKSLIEAGSSNGQSATNRFFSGLSSAATTSTSPPSSQVTVCMDCKHAVEKSSLNMDPDQNGHQPNFNARRRMSYQDHAQRRQIVTKSLIFE